MTSRHPRRARSRRALLFIAAVWTSHATAQTTSDGAPAPAPDKAADQPATTGAAPRQLDKVVVTAAGRDRSDLELQQPATVLRGDALREREATNLGDTLAREIGVQSSSYGAGAGRPIIRGMDAARVRVTESGLGVADLSGASPDHRVAADPFNSSQVEILRGPATLLYGSGASGGLVNLVSERIPRERTETFGGGLGLRGSTAERERLLSVDGSGPLGSQASWRLEGFKQRTDDYELAAPVLDADGNLLAQDRLPNSATDTRSVALGAAWFGAPGTRFGLAVQRYESDYGIPNPLEPVTIDLRRSRVELAGDTGALGPFTGLRSRFAFTDYEHTEFEPDGAAGANFTNRGGEARFELPHAAWGGWQGLVGAQLQQMRTRGVGEGELPQTRQRSAALFIVEERSFGPTMLELGARAESVRYEVDEAYSDGTQAASRDFGLASAAAAIRWPFAKDWDVGLGLTLSQRAPALDELYFVGAHPATFAFQQGDPALGKERSGNLELSLRRTAGTVRGKLNVYANRVRDYIFGFFDGSTQDILDEDGNIEETLSVLRYTQADARLRGAEAELVYGADTGAQARLWSDLVRAQLRSGPASGDNLPRMSPARLGLDLGWRESRWNAQLSVLRVWNQDRVAVFDLRDGVPESPTAGYTRVDAACGGSRRLPCR